MGLHHSAYSVDNGGKVERTHTLCSGAPSVPSKSGLDALRQIMHPGGRGFGRDLPITPGWSRGRLPRQVDGREASLIFTTVARFRVSRLVFLVTEAR
jgi:hypothetical protein